MEVKVPTTGPIAKVLKAVLENVKFNNEDGVQLIDFTIEPTQVVLIYED